MGKIGKIEDFLILLRCFIVTGSNLVPALLTQVATYCRLHFTEVANYGDTLTPVANVPPVISASHGKDVATRCRYQFAAAAIGTSGAP